MLGRWGSDIEGVLEVDIAEELELERFGPGEDERDAEGFGWLDGIFPALDGVSEAVEEDAVAETRSDVRVAGVAAWVGEGDGGDGGVEDAS